MKNNLSLRFMFGILLFSISFTTTSVAITQILPKGNYVRSCYFCSFQRGVLHCSCLNENHIPHWNSYYVPPRCNFIENLNGQLSCTHWDRLHPHPYPYRPYTIKRDFPAGPIVNNNQAQRICSRVCYHHNSNWNGQWRTLTNENSVCGCQKKIWRSRQV